MRQRILAAAVDVAEATGLRKVSMNEIARRARVGRATLYLHFSGRDDLVSAMIDFQLQSFIADIRQYLDSYDDPEDRLVHGFGHAFRTMAGNRALQAVLKTRPELLTSAVIGDSRALNMGSELVETTMGTGDLRDTARAMFAEHVARMFHTYILIPTRIVAMSEPGVAEEFAREFLVPVRNALMHGAEDENTDRPSV